MRDDYGKSDLLFQTSDATWQAYNTYSQNLYSGAHKVSYNRPLYVTKTPSQIIGAEYPMIRWLERNGFDVSYTTNVDTHRRGYLLLPNTGHHKVFLSVGHDEYWSGEMRNNVTAARNAGLNLAFFSGNEVHWKTRYESTAPSAGASTANRTLVCYKESYCSPDLTTSNARTSTWANSGRPENELTGQTDCIAEDLNHPLSVPASYQKLRFWRHTSLATTGQPLQVPDMVGYEWDPESKEFQDHYPKGRIRLSESVINGRVHHASLYRHSNGAWVFGAGTISWSWGLDKSSATLPEPPNRDIQQATLNLLLDMGVANPTTVQSNLHIDSIPLVDGVAPSVSITSPSAPLSLGEKVVISGTATDNRVVAGVEVSTNKGATWRAADWQAAGSTGTWQFTWMPPTLGKASIRVRSFDDFGNWSLVDSLAVTVGRPADTTHVFHPQDKPDALRAIANKVAGPGACLLGMKFRASVPGQITGVRFYKVPGDGSQHVGLLYDAANPTHALAAVTFAGETAYGWQKATFSPAVSIDANKTYVIAYYSPLGYYASTSPAFAQPVINGPLHGLAYSEGNGVKTANVSLQSFNYAPTLAMPTDTTAQCGTNYWVDADFVPFPAQTLFASSDVPAGTGNGGPANAGQLGTKFRASLPGQVTGVRFYKVLGDTGRHVGQLYDANGTLKATAAFTGESASGWQEAAFAQPVAIPANTTYTISYHSSAGVYSYTLQGFAQAVVNGPLRGLADGEDGGNGVFSLSPTPTFPTSSSQANNYWVDPVFVPTPTPVNTLFWPTQMPAGVSNNFPLDSVQLGMKFRADVPGLVKGVRFYKADGDQGQHVGQLYSRSGLLLATVNFTNESAYGWQQATFPSPVAIVADSTYVISYFSPQGGFTYTSQGFAQAIVNGPLRGLANGQDGGNGVGLYTNVPTFPTQTSNATNYWVDAVFEPGLTSAARPALSSARNTAKPASLYLTLTPNPASEYILATFASTSAAPAFLTIYDTRGVAVRNILIDDLRPGVTKQVRIETDRLPAGLYLFKFSNSLETNYSKALIVH